MLTNLILAVAAAMSPAPPAIPYGPGQVWEYRHRPQDQGSLLKIQRAEMLGGKPVYHVSVIRVRIGAEVQDVQHVPVSPESLDGSVTRLARDPGTFPSADEGISIWRKDEGGYFTISMAEIVDVLEKTVTEGQPR